MQTAVLENGFAVVAGEVVVFNYDGMTKDYPKAPSTQQQYWAVALLRELESEGMVEQVEEKGPWRLK